MQLEIIKFIQQIANPFWDVFFTVVSALSEEAFLIALLGLLYWCVDKRLGYKIGFLYVTNAPLNFIIKAIADAPRPIGSEGIRSIYTETATGSSFPSGHSQLGGGLFYFLFKNTKTRWWRLMFLLIAILIPISRLYLGVHFPIDVTVGFALGVIMVYVSGFIFEKLYDRYTGWLILFALPSIIFCIAERGADSCKMAGLVTAFLIGMAIEKKYIDFSENASMPVQILKYLCGVGCVIALRAGLKAFFPDIPVWGFVRYFIIGVFVTVVYPAVIKKFTHIADKRHM
jgi:membrane-associated phospholipid phosphatase